MPCNCMRVRAVNHAQPADTELFVDRTRTSFSLLFSRGEDREVRRGEGEEEAMSMYKEKTSREVLHLYTWYIEALRRG